MFDSEAFPPVQLGDLVEILDSRRIPLSSEERDKRRGDVPYYGANGLVGTVDKALFNEPLILMAEDGGNFDDFRERPIAYRVDGPSWVNNHAHILRAASQTPQSFIYWAVVHKDIRRYIAGGTRAKLNQSELKEIEIGVPGPQEAELIAQILDTLDTQIQKTETLIAKLEKIKEGLLHDLLTRGIDQNGQLRPEPEQAPELYKESTLGLIPREWNVCTTGEISRSIVPGRDKPKLSDSGIPWITISDLSEDRVTRSMLGLYVDERQIRTSMIRTIPAGSVIMSCVGDFGITSIAECETIINQQLHCFVVNSGIDADWLMYSLRQKKNTIDRSATQTTIKYLNKTGCESIELPTPPLAEQTAIIGEVLPLAKRIEEEKKHSEKLTKTKNGLMDDLLTGRVGVTPLLTSS